MDHVITYYESDFKSEYLTRSKLRAVKEGDTANDFRITALGALPEHLKCLDTGDATRWLSGLNHDERRPPITNTPEVRALTLVAINQLSQSEDLDLASEDGYHQAARGVAAVFVALGDDESVHVAFDAVCAKFDGYDATDNRFRFERYCSDVRTGTQQISSYWLFKATGLEDKLENIHNSSMDVLTSTPQFVDVVVRSKGPNRILGTIVNTQALLEHREFGLRHNIITKRVEPLGLGTVHGAEMDMLYTQLIDTAVRHSMPTHYLQEYIYAIAYQNSYNPVTDWLSNQPNPMTEPLREFIEHCGFEKPDMAMVAWRRWLIQAVAAADNAARTPNHTARPEFPYVIVLLGGQGLAKTSLMYQLLPSSMADYFTAGAHLNTNDKDSILKCVGNWIVELGELDSTFRKSDISALKAFLTNQIDEVRKPYARSAARIQRRTCYIATVNHENFLRDLTGSRRFWPISLTKTIPRLPSGLSEQLWGWAWHMYMQGEPWWPTPSEEALLLQSAGDHEDIPIKEALLDHFDFQGKDGAKLLTGSQILTAIGWPTSDRSGLTALGLALKSLGITKSKYVREYPMPPERFENGYS